jgi:ectoine hydroxylase-related dioxygenase (phytanoyl-CoA dioxygenase family)
MISTEALLTIQLRDVKRDVEHHGFAMVPDIVDDLTIEPMLQDVQRVARTDAVRRRANRPFGIRNLVNLSPSARSLAASEAVVAIARAVVGDGAVLVRSLFLDKIAEANWKVIWHQDRTIAVQRRIETHGFSSWTVKAGVPHVQPPASVLERMIALRIHLDGTDEFNGALKVIPGSHQLGRLSQPQIKELSKAGAVTCVASRGSILVMRPLLLHSSSACAEPTHRRVIHFEFAGTRLPGGLAWHES